MALTKITRGVIKANENYDTHNINSTGIVTAVSANFTGNVSIGGTLTYQDVTNIDSVGIITAQSDISIADKIVHTGDTNTALRFPAADTITAETGGTERLRIKSDGKAYFSGNLGLGGQTSPGAPIHLHNFGNDGYELKITGNALQFNRSSSSYIDQLHDTGSILFRMTSSNTEAMRITSGGESKFTVGTNKYVKIYAATHNDEANLGAGIAFSRPSDGADMLSGMFAHSNTGLGIAARDHITLLTGGTSNVSDTEERLRISSNGNVGINATSPSTKLDVRPTAENPTTGSPAAGSFLQVRADDATVGKGPSLALMNLSGSKETGWRLSALTASGNNGDFTIHGYGGGATYSEYVRITSDGKVGIGENSPDGLLVIKGDSNGASNPSIRLKDGSDTREAWITNAAGDLILANGGNDNTPHCKITMFDGNILSFETANTERFRINSGGIHITNGVSNIYETFRLTNNQAYNWDYTVPNEGGYGNSFYLVAGYNHYYTTSYGAHRTVWFSTRGTSVNAMGNGIEQFHSQSGSWTFSKPNSTTVRITKSAGTYGGQGYGFFHLMYNHF